MPDTALADAPQAAYRPDTPWKPLTALAVVLLVSLAPVLVGLAAVVAEDRGFFAGDHPRGSMSLSSPFVLAQMIIGQVLSLAILWWAAGWKGARSAALHLQGPPVGLPAAVGLALVLIVAIAPIEILLYKLAGISLFTDGRWLLEGLRSPSWWAVVVAAVVLAPLWEELTFRGFLLSALAKSRLGYWPAAIISTGVWTFLHWGYSAPGLASVFLAGIGLSWIMWRTGSMRAVVIAHGVINAVSLTVLSLFAP